MEVILNIFNSLVALQPEQKVFLLAVLGLLLAGFSLYVVLIALKKGKSSND